MAGRLGENPRAMDDADVAYDRNSPFTLDQRLDTLNHFQNNTEGPLPMTPEWMFKLSGSYTIPRIETNFGLRYRYDSGRPIFPVQERPVPQGGLEPQMRSPTQPFSSYHTLAFPMLKPALQLKLGQQLTMTPQLQQAIRLLQLSNLELEAVIAEEMAKNPLLESPSGEDEPAPAAGDARAAARSPAPRTACKATPSRPRTW